LEDRFGSLPDPTEELIKVASLRLHAKSLGITDISFSGKNLRLFPVHLSESAQVKLTRLYPGSIYKNASQTLLVSRAATANWVDAPKVGNTSLLAWVDEVIENLISPDKRRNNN
jgi:transcription-repair coupling factor (superfamily II helicase)